jgi:Na+/melibiose symporter-like transporter
MINDPLMGQLTDRTRSKMVRRVPYVLFGAIPLGLSFFFLWTPLQTSPFVLAAYFFIMLFIFDTLYSLTIIAYNSLFPEDARIHGYRREGIFFGMNGGIVKAAFSFQGILFATVFSISGYVSGSAVQDIGAIWGIRFLIGITPIISIIISTILLLKYPLGRQTLKNNAVPA